MITLSTGEPSTLGVYRKYAMALTLNNEGSKVVKFFDKKIAESPNGENEEVLADERQMIYAIMQMIMTDKEPDGKDNKPIE